MSVKIVHESMKMIQLQQVFKLERYASGQRATKLHAPAKQNQNALWSITAKNTDCSTGPLARLFAHSLAPLTPSLTLHCPPRSALARSAALTRLLARSFTYSQACERVNSYFCCIFSPLDQSDLEFVRGLRGLWGVCEGHRRALSQGRITAAERRWETSGKLSKKILETFKIITFPWASALPFYVFQLVSSLSSILL